MATAQSPVPPPPYSQAAVRVVHGSVLQPDGSPCSSGTLVVLIGQGRVNGHFYSESIANPAYQFRTDAAGRFTARFSVPPDSEYVIPPRERPSWGAYQFAVPPTQGFAGALSAEFYVLKVGESAARAGDRKPAGDQPLDLTLPLKKGITVQGAICDRDGKSVGRMPVTLFTIVEIDTHTSGEGSAFEQKTQTDESGRYRFENVYPGRFKVYLGRERFNLPYAWLRTRLGRGGWQEDCIDRVTPKAGEQTVRLDIGLAPRNSFSVSGRVTDPSGKPLAGAEIFVSYALHRDPNARDYTDYHQYQKMLTDADGRYRMALDTPWLLGMTARKDGYSDRSYVDVSELPRADENRISRVKLVPGSYDFSLAPKPPRDGVK